jgi:hypothetical protein
MHIDIRYHYIREAIINNSISVVQFPTEENILTKGLDKLKHYKRIEMLGQLVRCLLEIIQLV